MVICDRCRDESRNTRVSFEIDGINPNEINAYQRLLLRYSKDLCINCKIDLLSTLKQFFDRNPKVPQPVMYSQHELDQRIKEALENKYGPGSENDDVPF